MSVWLTRLAFVAGLGLAVALVASWQIAPARGSARLDLTLTARPSGPLAVDPAGPVLVAREMEAETPRRSASGHLTLRNQTATRLLARPHMDPADRTLDHLLALRISADGRVLYDGPMAGLRRGGSGIGLAPGQLRTIRVRAWLPRSSAGKFLGEQADVPLDFVTRPAS